MNKNFLLFVFYFFSAALLYPFLKYYIDSADTLQYITIAKNYSEGNFADAVNSFWNPLISWLLIPFVFFGMELVFAFKILQIIIGFFTLLLVYDFVDRTRSANWVRISLKAACVPLLLSYAFLFSTPDLLLLTFYLCFVWLLKNNRSPLLIGICGAAMYFTKGFGFAFFITALAIVFLYKIFSDKIEKKKAASWLLKSYAVFFLLCAPWVYLISVKENGFVISSAGSNQLNLNNPSINPDPFDDIHYPFEKGILSEPPPHAVSAWVYQHRLVETKWNPFASTDDFFHCLKVILRNILSVGSFHFGADAGTVLVLVLILLLTARKAELKTLLNENAFFLITSVTCTMLYILLMTIHRYLWINDIAIIILFSALAPKLFEWKYRAGIISLAAFIFLLLYVPVKSLVENINSYKEIYVISHSLKTNHHLRGNIVSLIDSFPDRNHRLSHLVSYYTAAQYYGIAGEHNARELREQQIDFALDWSSLTDNWLEKNNLADKIIAFPEVNLTVYQITDSIPRKD